MDKPKKLQDIINSVGALAEMTAIYRTGLLNQNIPKKEVIQYTVAFITATFGRTKGEPG